jgi:hypothetical protein
MPKNRWRLKGRPMSTEPKRLNTTSLDVLAQGPMGAPQDCGSFFNLEQAV